MSEIKIRLVKLSLKKTNIFQAAAIAQVTIALL